MTTEREGSHTGVAPGRRRSRTLPARVARLAALALFLLAVPLTLVLGAVRFAFSWQPVYTYAVEAYHADATTGFPQSELLAATHSIRNYFTDSRRDLNISIVDAAGQSVPLFNQREIAHMRDVKALVQRFYLLLDLAAAYVALYLILSLRPLRRSARAIAADILRASTLTIVVIVGFGVASLLDFNQLFTEFHILSFSNDFWQLDPARDHLVQIFPQGFWLDVTLFVAFIALAAAALLALGAWFVLYAARHLEPHTEG